MYPVYVVMSPGKGQQCPSSHNCQISYLCGIKYGYSSPALKITWKVELLRTNTLTAMKTWSISGVRHSSLGSKNLLSVPFRSMPRETQTIIIKKSWHQTDSSSFRSKKRSIFVTVVLECHASRGVFKLKTHVWRTSTEVLHTLNWQNWASWAGSWILMKWWSYDDLSYI